MDQPIACTLQPDQLADRKDQLSELARRALRSRAPIADGERLVFAPGAETEERLREAIAAEAACCSFLRMELHAAADALVLDVTGPPEAEPLIAALFA